MGRADEFIAGRLPELLAVTAVIIPGLILTAIAGLLVAMLAAIVPGAAAGVAGTAFALVVGTGLAGTLLVAALTWMAVSRARRTVRPHVEDTRVHWYGHARRLESAFSPARVLGLSRRLEPDEDTIIATLRRRYVAGELDEDGFERELERLLGGSETTIPVEDRDRFQPASGESEPQREVDADIEREVS